MSFDPMLPNILESAMLVAFGAAWPVNILTSLRSRTAKGKSLSFLIIVIAGYICGISAKLVAGAINYVLFFYILNIIMVAADVCLYFKNCKLDKAREALSLNLSLKDTSKI